MITPNDGGAAFPGFYCTDGYGCSKKSASGEWESYSLGMTLRDYFASQALAGMMTGEGGGGATTLQMAQACYSMADAMLEARKQ